MLYAQLDVEVSERVLEQTPAQATNFLSGVAAVPEIRAILAQAGMTDSDLEEGRAALMDVLAVPPVLKPQAQRSEVQGAAAVEVDQWDEPNFQRIIAVLKRYYPSAARYVFHELAPSTGVGSVQGVLTLLARLDALETGSDPERAATADDDKKAVEALATRGIDKQERERIRGLATLALGADLPPAPVESPNARSRAEKLLSLRRWYEDWAATAHAVVRKRSYLIRLGLGKRHKRAEVSDSEPAAAAAPSGAPSA